MTLWHCCLNYIHHCYLTFKLTVYVNILQFLHNRKSNLKWKSNPRICIIDSCCKQQTLHVFLWPWDDGGSSSFPFFRVLFWLLNNACNHLQSNVSLWVEEEAKNKGVPQQRETKVCDCLVFVCMLLPAYSLWPMDCSPPGSSVHGIFQERILEWFAISFSRGSSQPMDWTWVS